MSSDITASTNLSALPASIPSVPIEITGGILLHIGPRTAEDYPKEHKEKGYKIVWVMTPEELKANMPLADERTLMWENDEQLRRLLHDSMSLWMGAKVLPEGERQKKVAAMMSEVANLHQFNEHSNVVLSKDDLPTRNSFKNYHWFEDGVPISRLHGRGKGQPAVLIAAGPSLNTQWGYLREMRKKLHNNPFIICGRTYKKAMQEGVWPEFVMEVEQYDWDAELFMFAPDPPQHTVLAFPCTAAPRLAKVWPGPKLCLLNHDLAKLMGLKLGEESIDGGNSVLHYQFTLASMVFGCNPIYLAGVDFGYPKGRAEDTHATGTFHAWGTEAVTTEHVHQEGAEVEANDGTKIMSSPAYQNFGTYLAVQVERAKKKIDGLKVYSFSEKGMKVAGVEYKNIEEMVK